ncbi:hypothetical protein BC835DRAFT_1411481 [Cytidiella melzeri]|nr:hypothetical protein BC835DRAFT_1411481 [Cytidiella melzeri]
MSCGLYDLPIELLYEIQVHSCWHALPLASKRLYSIFKAAPSSVRAEYLVYRYLGSARQPSHSSVVSKSLRYPICEQPVLEFVLGLPNCPEIPQRIRTELPRRLFRTLSSRPSGRWHTSDPPLPILRYLYSHPRIPTPDPNVWDGYALTKAVAAGFVPLVRFLLDQGASPACKRGLAVHAAIRRKDLALVKLLVEPDPSSPSASSSNADAEEVPSDAEKFEASRQRDAKPLGGKRRLHSQDNERKSRRTAKKRRLEDRVIVTQEMLKTAVACDARDIVQYFVQEKSCMPDMQTVRTMRLG